MDLPILMYHAVERGVPSGYAYAVGADQFEGQLDAIQRAGFTTVALARVVDAVDGRSPLPPKPIVLTFDDAYRCVHEVAWPLMRERGLCGTVFAVADHLGGTNEWDRQAGWPVLDLMSAGQLRELAAAGWEVGSHGCRHADLVKADARNRHDEIRRSREVLAGALGLGVDVFAYPYGRHDADVVERVRRAGYRGAVSIFSPARSVTADRFRMRRVLAHRGDTAIGFRIKLSRAYLRYVAWRDGCRHRGAAASAR